MSDAGPGPPWREVPLRLAPGQRERLDRWARAAAPREACGVLLGREEGCDGTIVRVARLANRAHGRGRFELDPRQIVRLERAARRAGLTAVGVWHSHPAGDARPSAADLREGGGWPHHVIAALRPRGIEVRRFERVPAS